MAKEGKLTKRQKEILEYIKKYSAQKKYPPSIREIATNFNLSSPATAHVHVKKLIEKGYLKRGKTSNHLLELQVPNEYEYKNDDVVTVPLLGKVTAGNPIEAIEVPNEVISLPSYLLPKRKENLSLTTLLPSWESNGKWMLNMSLLPVIPALSLKSFINTQ